MRRACGVPTFTVTLLQPDLKPHEGYPEQFHALSPTGKGPGHIQNRTNTIVNCSTVHARVRGDFYRGPRQYKNSSRLFKAAVPLLEVLLSFFLFFHPSSFFLTFSHFFLSFFFSFAFSGSTYWPTSRMDRSSVGHSHNREKLLKDKVNLYVRRLESIYREKEISLSHEVLINRNSLISTYDFGNNNYYCECLCSLCSWKFFEMKKMTVTRGNLTGEINLRVGAVLRLAKMNIS